MLEGRAGRGERFAAAPRTERGKVLRGWLCPHVGQRRVLVPARSGVNPGGVCVGPDPDTGGAGWQRGASRGGLLGVCPRQGQARPLQPAAFGLIKPTGGMEKLKEGKKEAKRRGCGPHGQQAEPLPPPASSALPASQRCPCHGLQPPGIRPGGTQPGSCPSGVLGEPLALGGCVGLGGPSLLCRRS